MWELHPCSISGLWAVVCSVSVSSVSFLFRLWLLSFLSLLPPCRVLLRISCCLVITVWLSPSYLLLSVLLKSPAASTALQPPLPPPPVSLLWFCIAVVFLVKLFFGGGGCSFEFIFCLLTCFLFDCQTPPSSLPAVRSPMVQCCACLQFCGWSVGLSPVHVKLCRLVLCRGLSSEWTMCIKLCSFLVWLPHINNVKCHVEVILLWNDFSSGKISVWGVSLYQPVETQSETVALTVEGD